MLKISWDLVLGCTQHEKQ